MNAVDTNVLLYVQDPRDSPQTVGRLRKREPKIKLELYNRAVALGPGQNPAVLRRLLGQAPCPHPAHVLHLPPQSIVNQVSV